MSKKELKNLWFEAARNGDFDSMKNALEQQADVNWYDLNRWSALTWACYFHKTECVKFLIENKADVNHQNMYGYTPLAEAIYKEYWDIVLFLLENNADVNLKDHEGNNALMYFLWCKKDNQEVFLKLKEKTTNLQLKNKKGFTAKALVEQEYKEEDSGEVFSYKNPEIYLEILQK